MKCESQEKRIFQLRMFARNYKLDVISDVLFRPKSPSKFFSSKELKANYIVSITISRGIPHFNKA